MTMNPLFLLAAALAWYVVCEFILSRLRARKNQPTTASFWMGLSQSIGTFGLVVVAAIVFFLGRK